MNQQPEEDRRYRILVNLVRSDRPAYWTFHCMHCQKPFGELANAEIESVTDFFDMRNTSKVLRGDRCDGRSPTGIGRCGFWYYFNLAEKPVPKPKR